jgi:shikimate kinase
MKIFLIGLPGSGKTTLGKKVASSLNIPFLDLDQEIELQEQKSVAEIFAQHGENAFREKESNCLKRLANSENNFVMATGGGSPCFFNNLEVMNNAGTTIFLNPPLSEIASRLYKTDLNARPLFAGLQGDQIIEKLNVLLSKRILFYRKTKKILAKENLLIEDILKAIKE